MSDIIDELDRLHAKAIRGLRDDSVSFRKYGESLETLWHLFLDNWPAISARLREAERHMVALAAVNTGLVGIGRNGTNYRQWCAWRQTHGGTDGPTAISEDLLTAIKAALAAKETEQ